MSSRSLKLVELALNDKSKRDYESPCTSKMVQSDIVLHDNTSMILNETDVCNLDLTRSNHNMLTYSKILQTEQVTEKEVCMNYSKTDAFDSYDGSEDDSVKDKDWVHTDISESSNEVCSMQN
ncbi:unnamed protein product [Diabrotica balteata]|uniref:Uncharacterized protein n=1 Tax=Diabrotica balteata TaxID=107213 RepID=A0A9N9X7X0_DIABA|nr:unnamed protein product [Diabrotica balteata]